MDSVGPLYCETGTILSFINEPINTVTNVASLIAAFTALYFLRRRNVKSWETNILIALLIATGVGSALWHGSREPLALIFDFLPGGLFFLFFLFFWAKELHSRWFGYGTVILLFLLQFGTGFLFPVDFSSELSWGFRVHGITAVVGLSMVLYTYHLRGKVALWALAAVFLYIVAATARTIDLLMCKYIPFGTHFLWHISLASAAFCGIVLIAMLKKRGAEAPSVEKHMRLSACNESR